MRWWTTVPAIALCPAAAIAADEAPPRIVVTGSGMATSTPDRATIEFRVTGEGATSDAAVAAMVAKRGRIADALGAIDPRADVRAGEVSVGAVRGDDCKRDDDEAPARLSTGKCAIVGYVASLRLTLRSSVPRDAGTIVGLLSRSGADRPHLQGFALADPAAAQRVATAAALADARRQAEAIAAGSGARLGRLLSVQADRHDGSPMYDVVVTGSRVGGLPPSPPIVVDLTPQPIETRAQVTVTYAIAP